MHKNRNENSSYNKILKKTHNTIGATNNININYYNSCTYNKINQITNINENIPHKIKKNRTASSNIISKIIQLNKTNNSMKSNKEENKKAIISNCSKELNNIFIRNGQRSEKLNKRNSEPLEYQISFIDDNNKNLVDQFEKVKGDEVAQINQLKMVLNLLDTHDILKNPNLFTCFNHWKKLISIKRRKKAPKIDEKIISLKSNRLPNFKIDNNVNFYSSLENRNKYYSSVFYRSNSTMENNNIDNNIYDNNIINNIYIKSGQNHNKNCESLQENNSNVHIHKIIYQKKKLYSSNYNIVKTKPNENCNNPSRLVFRDIKNTVNHNNNVSLKPGKNDSARDLQINSDNGFYDERCNFYNMSTYNFSDNNYDELIGIKKINKIEEKEINFAKTKKNNNLGAKNNFKTSIKNNYFTQNDVFNN